MPFWIPPPLRQEPAVLLAGLVVLWLLTLYIAFAEGRWRALCRPKRADGQAAGAGDSAAAEVAARPVLGSAEVAAKVYDSAMTNFYAAMLDEAAMALSEFGYTVVAGWQGQHTLMLPDSIRDEVGRRVHYRRQVFVAPLKDDGARRERVERDVQEGYPQLMLDELILGWSKAGVFVVAPAVVPAYVPAEPVKSRSSLPAVSATPEEDRRWLHELIDGPGEVELEPKESIADGSVK